MSVKYTLYFLLKGTKATIYQWQTITWSSLNSFSYKKCMAFSNTKRFISSIFLILRLFTSPNLWWHSQEVIPSLRIQPYFKAHLARLRYHTTHSTECSPDLGMMASRLFQSKASFHNWESCYKDSEKLFEENHTGGSTIPFGKINKIKIISLEKHMLWQALSRQHRKVRHRLGIWQIRRWP